MMYAWIDLETTGLSLDCAIIEVALVVTDEKFDTVEEADWIVNPFPIARLEQAALEMHSKSGLWQEVMALDPSDNIGMIDVQASIILGRHVKKDEMCFAAGSSVHFDLGFVNKYMPFTANYLSHRILDTSSLKLFYASVAGESPDDCPPFKNNTTHRAMDDIQDSLEATRWYGHELRRGLI